jgi:hypothetical protein
MMADQFKVELHFNDKTALSKVQIICPFILYQLAWSLTMNMKSKQLAVKRLVLAHAEYPGMATDFRHDIKARTL